MMKKVIILFLLMFAIAASYAQPPAKPPFDTEWVYDKPYNFERAKKLEWEWEFEKAVCLIGGAVLVYSVCDVD